MNENCIKVPIPLREKFATQVAYVVLKYIGQRIEILSGNGNYHIQL